MDTNKKEQILDFILSSRPPYNKDDPYFIKIDEYWTKYGCISNGICESWVWYKKELEQLSLTELQDICLKLIV